MTKLEKMIKELCPDGVKYFSVGELIKSKSVETVTPSFKIKRNDYKEEGSTPIISQEAEYISGYSDSIDKNIPQRKYVCFGDHSEHIKYVDFAFVQGADGLKIMYTDESVLHPRYFYYSISNFYKNHNNYERHFKYLNDTYIPVPPLKVQREIVRILDNFTELTAELMSELELRKKQYSELSYQLLIKKNNSKLHFVKDLCELSKGKTPIQKAEPGDYPLVVTTSERKSCKTYQYDTAAVCIPLVSSRGHGVASLNHVYYQEGKFALGNILCAVVPTDENVLSAKYLYFYFECTKDYTLVPLMKGGANVSMHIPDIEKVKIPVPDIETQHSIVSKLEILDEYCNITLPAEIEARQKQYEYYRDELLTFKELSV